MTSLNLASLGLLRSTPSANAALTIAALGFLGQPLVIESPNAFCANVGIQSYIFREETTMAGFCAETSLDSELTGMLLSGDEITLGAISLDTEFYAEKSLSSIDAVITIEKDC